MDEIDLNDGINQVLDSLLSERLALVCGAGLSMAAPSSIPSAAKLAEKAKAKYDATYGADRKPLSEAIEEQAQFFFDRGELETVYLRTYVDADVFSAHPNSGHTSIADLMLVQGISTTVSTNVDTLIETAGNMLLGHIGKGVARENGNCPGLRPPSERSDGLLARVLDQVDAAGLRLGISELKFRDQLPGVGVGQGFEDVPVLLSCGGDDGPQVGEVAGALHRAEAT